MVTTNLAAKQAWARSLRRSGPTAIAHSGERRTIYDCICGAVHSCATQWRGREAQHVLRWRAEHEAKCNPRWARILAMRDPRWLASRRDAIYSDDTH